MEEIFKYLAASGDVGVVALVIVLIKLNTRLTVLETLMGMKHGKSG